MKVAGIREFRSALAAYLSGDEPVLVMRHGKVSGVYLPLERPDRVPDDLRRELASVLGRYLSLLLDAAGISEQQVQHDFDARRRHRR